LSALYLGGGPPLTRGRGATSADNGLYVAYALDPTATRSKPTRNGMHLTVEMRRGLVKSRRVDSTRH